jgi:U3 small nucleolar RNA-associated protein 21
LLGTVDLGSPISRFAHHVDHDLLAVATDDLMVHVLDTAARRVVRRFRGHTNGITDMALSPDGRWLVTSSMDASCRVFDLPSGRLIDWFAFDKAVTSLSFSPKSDFLATTHVNNLGIFLWVNRSYFSNVYLRSSPDKPTLMDMPITHTFSDSAEEMVSYSIINITLYSVSPRAKVINDNNK